MKILLKTYLRLMQMLKLMMNNFFCSETSKMSTTELPYSAKLLIVFLTLHVFIPCWYVFLDFV